MTETSRTILAFDTSTPSCSAALLAGETVLGEDTCSGAGNYSALLLQAIDRLLRDAALAIDDIDCIAVAQGPGSFTGLRVGISTAQGLGFALAKPIIGISTLEIVAAQNMPFAGTVCPMLDARRSQVYTCLYEQSGSEVTAVSEPNVVCPEVWVSSLQGPVLFCGSGAQVYRQAIGQACAAEHSFAPEMNSRPRAAMLARIALRRLMAGQTRQPAQILPCYVRRPDAERASTAGA
jgi:tRNA threonylcarbamoyladenosine biosynthesis protein TsaB